MLDVHLMSPYLKYNGTLDDIRTRNLMFTIAGPYLKNRSTKPKDMMPLAIDSDYVEDHTPETSISAKQVDWYEKNKGMFEEMMLPKENITCSSEPVKNNITLEQNGDNN